MKMSNEMYDLLKDCVCIWLPAIATCYAVVGKIWGLPFTIEIPATIAAVATCLGTCLKISTNNYNKQL